MPTIKKTPRRPWQPERKPFGRRANPNSAFYYSTPWRRLRAVKIAQNPMCEECARHGRITEATVVDHIKPINQGGAPLNMENLQSLCALCHNIKSAKEAR